MKTIERPTVDFDAIEHAYSIQGKKLLGVSTVAKVGGVEDTWGIASAWGFRIGYEGAHKLASERGALQPFTFKHTKKGEEVIVEVKDQDSLRAALNGAGLTPWATRDRAAERGSWVHDLLEELGQAGKVPDMKAFTAKHGAEAAGHAQSVLRWFLHYRPRFHAMEVQVASAEHGFAGRYDVECWVEARKLLEAVDPLRKDEQAERVRELAARGEWAHGLVDLKTSKGIYPATHFPQLEGYEGARREMGFSPTDFRAILNTWPTGEHDPARDMAVSWSTYGDFLAYLRALEAIKGITARDPETIREKARGTALLAVLEGGPQLSRDIAKMGVPELAGMDSRALGFALAALRKSGKVEQPKKGGPWQLVAESE